MFPQPDDFSDSSEREFVTEADGLAARDDAGAQLRSSAAMSTITLGSRVLGFVRILVVAGVLGSTFLGDTYATSNALPNLIFELLAAGALSAVLVPTLVNHLQRHDTAGAEQLAGGVLGVALAGMAVITVIGYVLAEPIARLLFITVDDTALRDQQVRLGVFFIYFFLPQTLFYVIAMVMTGVLQAHRRFVVPALAPLWNNLVVIGVYVLYGVLFGQTDPTDITLGGKLLLALGTTAGVVALSLPQIPFVRRLGFRIRVRVAWRDPGVRRIVKLGLYAIGYLGFNNLIYMVMIVLANSVEGVVPFTVAWAFFLLPYSLFAMAISTASFPAMSRLHGEGDSDAYTDESVRSLGLIAFCVFPVAAAYLALAAPLATVFRFGNMSVAGAELVTLFLQTFAIAVPAYGLFLGLTRIAYAVHDTRGPTVANGLGICLGIAIMIAVSVTVGGNAGLLGLGLGTAAAYSLACVLIARHHVAPGRRVEVVSVLARCFGVAVAMGLAAWGASIGLVDALGSGRLGSLVALILAGTCGLLVYLAGTRVLHVPAWSMLRRTR